MNRGPFEESILGLRMTMDHVDEHDLEEYGREDLEPGYHPRFHDTGRKTTYLIVKRLRTRSKSRGRGTEPNNLHLEIVEASDVPLTKYRMWKDSDDVELEELDKEELWNRIQGEEQENLLRTSDRREDE